MRNTLLKLYVKARITLDSLKNEDGQDLIEYALLAALVALAATATIKGLGTEINAVFSTITGNLTNAI